MKKELVINTLNENASATLEKAVNYFACDYDNARITKTISQVRKERPDSDLSEEEKATILNLETRKEKNTNTMNLLMANGFNPEDLKAKDKALCQFISRFNIPDITAHYPATFTNVENLMTALATYDRAFREANNGDNDLKLSTAMKDAFKALKAEINKTFALNINTKARPEMDTDFSTSELFEGKIFNCNSTLALTIHDAYVAKISCNDKGEVSVRKANQRLIARQMSIVFWAMLTGQDAIFALSGETTVKVEKKPEPAVKAKDVSGKKPATKKSETPATEEKRTA